MLATYQFTTFWWGLTSSIVVFPLHMKSRQLFPDAGESLVEILKETISARITSQSFTLHMYFFCMIHLISFQYVNPQEFIALCTLTQWINLNGPAE